MSTLFLTDHDVSALHDWKEAIEALRAAYAAPIQAQMVPPRSMARGDGIWLRSLSAVSPTGGHMGSKQIAASPTPATTELIAMTAIRNTHLVSPAERKRNQNKPVRSATGANRQKPRNAPAAEPKVDTVLELLSDLSTKDSNTRRLLEAEPDSETALSDTGVATKRADGAAAQLLSDAVESKASDSDKAAAKWYAVLRLP